MEQNKAHKFFFDMCDVILAQSKDPSTKTGCVIVGPDNEVRSVGYNGFPRGVEDHYETGRYERPIKYKWIEHAERNAIYNAARVGIPLKGCRLYIPWFPCADCCRAIIQSGITTLIVPENATEYGRERWGEDFEISKIMFREAGVHIIEVMADEK